MYSMGFLRIRLYLPKHLIHVILFANVFFPHFHHAEKLKDEKR